MFAEHNTFAERFRDPGGDINRHMFMHIPTNHSAMDKPLNIEDHQLESYKTGSTAIFFVKRANGVRSTEQLDDSSDHGAFFVDYSGRVWHCWYGNHTINMQRTICFKDLDNKKEVFKRINVMKPESEDEIVEGYDLLDDEPRVVSESIRTGLPNVTCTVLSYKYDERGNTIVRAHLSGIDLTYTFCLSASDVVSFEIERT
jgi:hypothetical protein